MKLLHYTSALYASAFAVTCALSQQSGFAMQPNTSGAQYVDKVTLEANGAVAGSIMLQNTSDSIWAKDATIAPAANKIDISADGFVQCVKDNDVDYDKATIYFGSVSVSGSNINTAQVLHQAHYSPTSKQWNGTFGGGWVQEAGNFTPYSVPLNAISEGHPALRFDPVEIFEDALQDHLDGGGKRVEFLKEDQSFLVQRKIAMVGFCKEDGLSTPKAAEAIVVLAVNYKGDKNLKADKVTLNANMGNNPNQVNQNLPMKLVSAEFQPNMPHYIGQCPPEQNPIIRVNYSGSGKGQVQFRIRDFGNLIKTTEEIDFDAKNGPQHFDFSYPLKQKLNSYVNWDKINHTINHPFEIEAKYSDINSDSWSDWEEYGSATWKHRCTPVTNGAFGGGIHGFQQDKPNLSNVGTIKVPNQNQAAPVMPADIKANPVVPAATTPTIAVQPQPTTPALPQATPPRQPEPGRTTPPSRQPEPGRTTPPTVRPVPTVPSLPSTRPGSSAPSTPARPATSAPQTGRTQPAGASTAPTSGR